LKAHSNKPQNSQIPSVIFGTSSLGNLYQAISNDSKKEIIQQCIQNAKGRPMFDTAGKYGAGLALEVLGTYLEELKVDPSTVIISNKLGWYQTELKTTGPSFEQDVWVNLKNDAIQKISYQGILECFEQGNKLLGKYNAQMVSVHDPDEYLAALEDPIERERRYLDILDAYRALLELKAQGKVASVGIGSKDWKVIQRICNDVELDWVMIANSLTIHSHPPALIKFIAELKERNITVINSAVFNGGFLIGSDHYNYKKINKNTTKGQDLYLWRYKFYAICKKFDVEPAQACFDFGFNVPGVKAIALNTSKPENIKINVEMAEKKVPNGFWEAMYAAQLINLPIDILYKNENASTDL
jgi:D-threo-aldose 1-dehydrogenase